MEKVSVENKTEKKKKKKKDEKEFLKGTVKTFKKGMQTKECTKADGTEQMGPIQRIHKDFGACKNPGPR